MPARLVPLSTFRAYAPAEMQERARTFAADLARRRTVRDYAPTPIPDGVLDDCIRAAGSAPSGANLQPWHFVVVTDPAIKTRIREAAEAEEREFYESRATPEWLAALEPLGTDANKPFLEIAPALIAIFSEPYGERADGTKVKHYYANESVGIATGLLVAAIHHAGLASLTHTPSPMGFLNEILARPARERPFLLLVVGYPAADATVPDISRKPLDVIRSVR